MEYRTLGGSGLKVSALGLGANQFGGKVDQETVRNILGAALDLGVNFIDTADVYQGGKSEECIGAGLECRRQAALIATKFFGRTREGPNEVGASRYHILRAVEGSLRRLNTDYIDLYQIHQWDSETPLEETMRALDDLIASGKVRYIGASNFTAWQLTWANALAELNGWSKFVSIQPHFHMFERGIEKELIPACAFFDIGILPYFPLAGGFLTGKYRQGQPPPPGSRGETSQYVQRYMTPENFSRLEKLKSFAERRGHQVNELALAWLMAQPQVSSVISGATKVEQVQANAASVAWELTPEEISEIRDILGSS
jgi:aryl-alcohol dehydrogenase-like predicted oxidoreductase